MEFITNFYNLFIDMAFYITIGLVLTGILHVYVPKDLISKQLGKSNLGSVVKASVIGVPLPLCSCGVVPTAIYLGKNGASKGAVTSFLTSTPQTGLDSIIATYGLMGPLFAIYRPIAAFFSGIFTGIATDLFSKEKINYTKDSDNNSIPLPTCGCGCHEIQEEEHCCCGSHEPHEEEHCCCGNNSHSHTTKKLSKFLEIFKFAFGSFLDEISVNFVVGLIIATLITTLVPDNFLSSFTSPLLSMVIMLVIGIPMYVCSTASIPIAVSLILKGISPGSAFVFLFAGPITNIASLAMLTKTLGKKVMSIYLISASICAILFGLLLDFIVDLLKGQGLDFILAPSHEHHSMLMLVVGGIFLVLLIKGLYNTIKAKMTKKAHHC